jgi:hypothetical protein
MKLQDALTTTTRSEAHVRRTQPGLAASRDKQAANVWVGAREYMVLML